MRSIGSFGLPVILMLWSSVLPVSALPSFPSLTEPIREEIAIAEKKLASLPHSPVNISPWTLGYCSSQEDDPSEPVVVEIRFPAPEPVDLVALIPATYTDERSELKAFGFPVRFKLERLLPDGSAQVIADHLRNPYVEPGIEPQLFPCPDAELASGLRITVTERASNPSWWKASHVFALSELYAFVGEQNVALGTPVKASSEFAFSHLWLPSCLTDGFSHLSPITHEPSNPMGEFSSYGKMTTLELDLGDSRQIDEVRLWPVVHGIQHDYAAASGIGFPQRILIKSSTRSDHSDARVLYDANPLGQRPGSGPLMHRLPPAPGRYVRFLLQDGLPDYRRKDWNAIALGEIELMENGRLVSGGVTPRVIISDNPPQNIGKLTDGRSNAGKILPLREWVIQIKQRVELERKLASLRLGLEKAQRREHEQGKLTLLAALGLIVILLQFVWISRVTARRRMARMRECIACDLHDEIGANVSSIAHTAELLDESIKHPSEIQKRLLGNLIENARLTASETKHFIRFIESENHALDLTQQFKKVAEQILGTIPTQQSFQSIRSFSRLDPATKWNLLMFFKETLNNIIKHSGAKAVKITTLATDSGLQLIVEDDGCGIPANAPPPRHLESRAKALGGTLDILAHPGEGTRVTLDFKGK